MRDHGDNTVYRIAAGADSDDLHWTEALMRSFDQAGLGQSPAAPFQALSLHYYTMTGSWSAKGSATQFTTDEWYLALARAAHMETLLQRHSTVMDRYDPQRNVGLVVDEWGTWWDVEPGTNPGFLYQQNTLRDALVASTHLDAFHRHADRVVMTNIAQTVNVLQAMLLTDPDSGALVLTPTYHVYEMSTGHHDADALAVHLKDVPAVETAGKELPLVSASASTRGDTALVSISHLDAAESRTLVVDLRGREVTAHTARVLTADRVDAHNTPDALDRVAPRPHDDAVRPHPRGLEVTLPPASFVTLSLTLA
ncbi:hypothetical protein CUD01_31610 [Cellulomonas uda]|uniref:Alpha-L-arabinofuranosidase C-terminal domain-containing protein n=1 Tax=Cellulomonas uda TaxID=1714 RepID=A0A4Y3KFD6_CELUD|nr:hypothetical protein CUD01_31610 [Cellulomonas uda]